MALQDFHPSLLLLTMLLAVVLTLTQALGQSNTSYLADRQKLLADEASRVVGSSIVLNDKEKVVDRVLLEVKKKEVLQGFLTTFPPTVNFLKGKPLVEKSDVLDIIKQMPKGGILHIHEISMAELEWVISNITYLPHLYYCVVNGYFTLFRFRFSSKQPAREPTCDAEWELVSEARQAQGADAFDTELYHGLSMFPKDPNYTYPNTTMSWRRFQPALFSYTDLFFSSVAFEPMLRRSLEQFVADNVQYAEIRTILYPIQNLDGSKSTYEYTMQEFIRVIDSFKKENPQDFVGAKIITSSVRHPVNRSFIMDQVNLAMQLRKKYPSHFAGYDLVAQEDMGGPLIDYLNELLTPSQMGVDLPYFFHAGETNWEGTEVDRNLIDAILLNTSRIGHGYAINKHPDVMATIKAKGIAVELNPISNQVLHLVHDIRDHIGAGLIADGYPVVVSSDDPCVWGALPLSHDYYMAFMGMTGADTGLTVLKQLALNTFKYSAMTATEQTAALKLWQAKWDAFVDKILARYG